MKYLPVVFMLATLLSCSKRGEDQTLTDSTSFPTDTLVVPDAFRQTVDSINSFSVQYDTLNPFSEYEENFGVIDSIREEIMKRLLRVLNDKRILKYPMAELFTPGAFGVTKSDDNRIYIFWINEKTGGSFRSAVNIIHYRLPNGDVKAEIIEGNGDAVSTSSYDHVYLVDSLRHLYFTIGSVQTCNTCVASVALTIRVDTAGYHLNPVFQFDGRYEELQTFEYDPKMRTFAYKYYYTRVDDSTDDEANNDSEPSLDSGKLEYIDGEFRDKSSTVPED